MYQGSYLLTGRFGLADTRPYGVDGIQRSRSTWLLWIPVTMFYPHVPKSKSTFWVEVLRGLTSQTRAGGARAFDYSWYLTSIQVHTICSYSTVRSTTESVVRGNILPPSCLRLPSFFRLSGANIAWVVWLNHLVRFLSISLIFSSPFLLWAANKEHTKTQTPSQRT